MWDFWLHLKRCSSEVLEGLRKLEYRGYDSAGLAAIFEQAHEGQNRDREDHQDMSLT